MKIAITSSGTNWDSLIDPRFGRAEFIFVFDDETAQVTVVDNNAVKQEAHGSGTVTAQKLYEIKPDVLITGNGPGNTAAQALRHLKMKIFVDAHNMTLKQAYEKYLLGQLRQI